MKIISIDKKRALNHLMDLLATPGGSGKEKQVANLVKTKLRQIGCKSSWIRHDKAHEKIGENYQVGNLIVRIPGTYKSKPRLFSGHLDTVPLCRDAEPVIKGKRIVPNGKTALGGDNRTSVAALITIVEELFEKNLPHPPLTLLFCVGEEVGLKGSKHVQLKDLGNPDMGFNIDSGKPNEVIVGAVGADRWNVQVIGRSSHAGVHPDHGISATLIASRAISEVAKKGFFGLVEKGKKRGTSNVGSFEGGEATNQVTDLVHLRGESRSHDSEFLTKITQAYKDAFENAAKSVEDHRGRKGKVIFKSKKDYDAFSMDESSPPVLISSSVIKSMKMKPKNIIVDGGLDASSLNAKGIPTVTLGAGQHSPHTVDEYVDIDEFLKGCQLAVNIASFEG